VYFPTGAAAAAAGYRACRRCDPDGLAPTPSVRKVAAAVALLDRADPGGVPPLAALARRVGASASQLQRAFVRALGVSPREYVAARKLGRLKSGLREGRSVADATFEAGFGSSSRVYEQAGRSLGMTPAEYRRGGSGLELFYTTAACPLGTLLVAGTSRGVSAVSLGDSRDELIRSLRAEFPAADLRDDPGALRASLETVLRHLNGEPADIHHLPLDVRATAFQRRVWKALQQIPAGSTLTYAEVAAMIGSPRATRAVAHACATNPAAVVVPCHRVVPRSGGTGAYRWGPARKAALLETEKRSDR
jgi:AraC family transcriptional regulator of adaptative response/methylated-DNA-[protein]-cysteine methyltransferase